jgi:RimJ/RimL family protein N-acetyltransferase
MEFQGQGFKLRPFRTGDEPALVRYGNNRAIWINLTDLFPHPYTFEEAQKWTVIANEKPDDGLNLAIELDGEAFGAVGFERRSDLRRKVAEIGYWLGEPFWGCGIAPAALGMATKIAFERYDFTRLQAGVIGWNPRSMRVLEKVGFAREGVERCAGFKDGKVCDLVIYVRLREGLGG